MNYNYIIEYKHENENTRADALSRRDQGEYFFLVITLPIAGWWDQLKDEVNKDSFYSSLHNDDGGSNFALF